MRVVHGVSGAMLSLVLLRVVAVGKLVMIFLSKFGFGGELVYWC